MTRRHFLATVCGVTVTATPATAAGVHVTGTLTASDTERSEGYFQLCAASGACHPTHAVMIAAHPKSAIHPHLDNLVGREVTLSVFEP